MEALRAPGICKSSGVIGTGVVVHVGRSAVANLGVGGSEIVVACRAECGVSRGSA